jgi:proto-oncogene C-crk
VEKVMGKYDFDGSDPDDLPFKKGELLTVVSKVAQMDATNLNVILG